MKFYLLTASAVAICALGLAAPKASAEGAVKTFDVNFDGSVASACNFAGPVLGLAPAAAVVTDGKLALSVTDGGTLETLAPGTITYACNTGTTATARLPEQQAIASAPEEITGTLTSKLESATDGVSVVDVAELKLLPGLSVLKVSMTATDNDGSVKAGDYEFKVPVDIVCD